MLETVVTLAATLEALGEQILEHGGATVCFIPNFIIRRMF